MTVTPVNYESQALSTRYGYPSFGSGESISPFANFTPAKNMQPVSQPQPVQTPAAVQTSASAQTPAGTQTSTTVQTPSAPAKKTKDVKTDEFIKKFENMPPAGVGLISGLAWFGIGIGLDRLVGVIFKQMKTSMKSSLIWNGIFGAVMGAMAFWRARKDT